MILALGLTAPGAAAGDCAQGWSGSPATLVRTDHDVSGNRIAAGCGPLEGENLEVELTGTPTWVLPDPTDRGRSWIVVLEDGTVELATAAPGRAPAISQTQSPPLAPGHPPLAATLGDDELTIGSALAAAGWFEAPLPDARVTELDGTALVALTGPTDRYAHGVLGDELEATAIDVRAAEGLQARIEVEADEVIEGTSAMVVKLASDDPESLLLVTVSDAADGARLRAYDLAGSQVAESAPIGQGFRWLHQIAAAPIGPTGAIEIIAVRTPHIDGRIEAYRLAGGRLERVASLAGYSSHRLGSANLDMALLADADGDGGLEVVVPTSDMRSLAVLERTAVGFEETERLTLDGELVTNVAATPTDGGALVLAAGTADGRLRIFR
ncbi:MAG: hypothetical protein PVH07_01455 [Chloroflexota bacterium]